MKARRKSPITAGKVAINRKKERLRLEQEAQVAHYREVMRGLRGYKQELEQDFDTLVQDYTWENAELRRKYAEAVQQLRDMQRRNDNQLSYMTALLLGAATGWGMYAWSVTKSMFFGG